MGLTPTFVDAHIAAWSANLSQQAYPHRAKWPSYLFHHSPLENAVRILETSSILSRRDSESIRSRDVAATGVIDSRSVAHDRVRLYFRPRTPTQYHIEGIRKAEECVYGENAHVPMLYMFVLDAKAVLCSQDIRFSDGNMQNHGTADGNDEAFFAGINFGNVYHEGGFNDDAVKRQRCAEVLPASPLPLQDTLKWVYCRSAAERDSLTHALSLDAFKLWQRRILVSDDLKVFEKRFAFVEEVSLAPNGVVFRLAPRRDGRPLDVEVETWLDGKGVVSARYPNLAARPPDGSSWRMPADLKDGFYGVRIRLEGHLAFESHLMLGEAPF